MRHQEGVWPRHIAELPDGDEELTVEDRHAGNVGRWARLLVMKRELRARDIEIAKLRDNFEAITGRSASATVPLEAPLAREGDRVEFLPRCSPPTEEARVTGKLRERGYNDRGVLESVEWSWMREIHEYLSTDEDLEGVAEAYVLADGVQWPQRPWTSKNEAWAKAQIQVIRSLYNRATRDLDSPGPLVPSRKP